MLAVIAYDMAISEQHDQVVDSVIYGYDEQCLPVTFSVQSGPSNGTLHLDSTGSFQVEPADGYVGTDSFVYRISNGIESNTGTVSIEFYNTAPYAYDSSETIDYSQRLSSIVNGYDLDFSEALTFSVIDVPNGGDLYFRDDGSYDYIANSSFDEVDSFTFTISDGIDSDSGTVELTGTPFCAALNASATVSTCLISSATYSVQIVIDEDDAPADTTIPGIGLIQRSQFVNSLLSPSDFFPADPPVPLTPVEEFFQRMTQEFPDIFPPAPSETIPMLPQPLPPIPEFDPDFPNSPFEMDPFDPLRRIFEIPPAEKAEWKDKIPNGRFNFDWGPFKFKGEVTPKFRLPNDPTNPRDYIKGLDLKIEVIR